MRSAKNIIDEIATEVAEERMAADLESKSALQSELEALRKIAEAAERFVSMNDNTKTYRDLKEAVAQWKEPRP